MASSLDLNIKTAVGFNGNVPGGLKYTTCGGFIVYPLGSYIVMKNLKNDRLSFIDGHTQPVTCIAISHDGRTMVTGEQNIPGKKADCIMWDLEAAKKMCRAGQDMIGDDCFIRRLNPSSRKLIFDIKGKFRHFSKSEFI